MFGKTCIGRLADMKDPLEENNDETLEDEEFGLRDIVD